MSLSLLKNSQFVTYSRRDELDLLIVQHPHFYAELVLQGAQLIHFAPKGEENWLWLSPLADYKKGQSVRGGVPICWPWFGNLAYNPSAVKNNVPQSLQDKAHGFARDLPWTLQSLEENAQNVRLVLSLHYDYALLFARLSLEAEFIFCKGSLEIYLHTKNNGTEPVVFTQALHSYFPTQDIAATRILGLENSRYIDTLTLWSEKHQQGAVQFTEETDRIYYSQNALDLLSPTQHLLLENTGSQSLVVWNPWVAKSKTLSQFPALAYQRMFCVESANALADAVHLGAGQTQRMGFKLSGKGSIQNLA